MSLWVPPSAAGEQMRAEVQALAQAAEDLRLIEYWNGELRLIDPALQLIKARGTVETPGLRPGYWHVVRDVPPAPPTLLPLVGDHGEMVEPTSRMLDRLKEGDLQNARTMRDRLARDDAATKARLKARHQGHEDRVEQMVDRVRSMKRAHVSMSDAAPWTYRAEARRPS